MLDVSRENEFAAIGNFASADYYINQDELRNLKFIPLGNDSRDGLCFAARKDYRELISIVDKVIDKMTSDEKYSINKAWLYSDSINYTFILKIASIVAFVLLLIFTISVYWIFRLRQEVEMRTATQKKMELAKQEAEMANRIKSSFLARMSHEIRTPMNAVIGMAHLLGKTGISATQAIYLRNINQAASTILGIINDILDFSKIEAGKVELEDISFNLDEVLQNVVSIISYRVREKRIGFNLRRDTALPNYFYGDSKRIEQILLNILNNAVKFTHEGEVTFSIMLNGAKDDLCRVSFIIQDSGIGMSDRQLEHLFEPFSQEDASINRQFGGTGLGLSIVKNLVELMDGTIKVQSRKGLGSEFTMDVSLRQDTGQEECVKQRSAGVAAKNANILVWEEPSKGGFSVINDYFSAMGIRHEQTDSPTETIAALENASGKGSPFDVFILDYDAPPGKGFEFLTAVKQNTKIKPPFVIMLLPMAGEEESLHEYDNTAGVGKPLIFSVLFDELYTVLQKLDTEKEAEPVSETAAGAGYYVLVVDDNDINRTIAEALLEPEGFTVISAESGDAGVRIFEEHKDEIDAVLMDLHMPGGINGSEAAERIRRMSKTVPIAAMTADVLEGVKEECENHGMRYFISKPFDPERFAAQVRSIVEGN
jgi:signal transduction histidine kinase/CheY-like chemotaxis protein